MKIKQRAGTLGHHETVISQGHVHTRIVGFKWTGGVHRADGTMATVLLEQQQWSLIPPFLNIEDRQEGDWSAPIKFMRRDHAIQWGIILTAIGARREMAYDHARAALRAHDEALGSAILDARNDAREGSEAGSGSQGQGFGT